MNRPLLILGTGGKVYELLDIIEAINAITPTWKVVGFLDDARPPGSRHCDLGILGTLSDAYRFPQYTFVNAIGNEKNYAQLPEILGKTGLKPERFATLVHPAAAVSARVSLGHGVTINHGVTISGGVTIGNHVTFCPGCIVGHDTTIEEYSILAPGATISGFVHLGRSCYIGAGAMIRQDIAIGDRALVGMGAVVVRAVHSDSVVVGNPAHYLRSTFHSATTREASQV